MTLVKTAIEERKRLSNTIFSKLYDDISQRLKLDFSLFSKYQFLPCLNRFLEKKFETLADYHPLNQQFQNSYQIERKLENMSKYPDINVEFESYLRESYVSTYVTFER